MAEARVLLLRFVPFRNGLDLSVRVTLGYAIHNSRATLTRSECSHLRYNLLPLAARESRNTGFHTERYWMAPRASHRSDWRLGGIR